MLAELARSNMFLVALDSRGEWYRYHHLFGEVLQLDLEPEVGRAVRRRAAEWCRAEGLIEDAIEYAAAAEEAELVADLLITYPTLPAIAATAGVVITRPDVEIQRLLAVADRSRHRECVECSEPRRELARAPQWAPTGPAYEMARRSARAGGGHLRSGVGARPVAFVGEDAAGDPSQRFGQLLLVGVLAPIRQLLVQPGA